MPLTIDLRPSVRLAALVGAVHFGALALVLWLPMMAWVRVPLAVALVASLAQSLRRLGPGRRATAVALSDSDAWSWQRASDGVWVDADLLGSYVHPALIILRLRARAGSPGLTVLLTADTVSTELLRALRVRIAGLVPA